ncbi:MAG: PD-(D/E)XK nuclease family protein [Acidobacteriota bacterium]
MPPLKNDFSWSLSRHKAFQACPRRYYLASYRSWGGWEARADKLTKLCYRLSKMQNLWTWSGAIVHSQIENCLRRIAAGMDPGESADLIEPAAIEALRVGWVQSKSGAWKSDPKGAVNLFEHYYDQPVEQRLTELIKQRVVNSLRYFRESSAFEFILACGPGRWKSLEQFQSFQLGKLKVGLRIDFAAATSEDQAIIWDWKTGKPAEDDTLQAAIYTLYAMTAWGYPLERVVTEFVYLTQGTLNSTLWNEQVIEGIRARIHGSAMELYALLDDPEKNLARAQNFPMTENRAECARCNFYEACFSTRKIEMKG